MSKYYATVKVLIKAPNGAQAIRRIEEYCRNESFINEDLDLQFEQIICDDSKVLKQSTFEDFK